MSKLGNMVRILAVPCILVGLTAGAEATSGARANTVGDVKIAAAETKAVAPASVAAAAPAPVAAAVPACARKVKVVYAGYGEADRAGCSVVSAETSR